MASLAELLGDASRPRLAGRLLGRLLGAGALGRLLARAMRGPMRARGTVTSLTRTHARVLRASGGRMRRSWLFAAGQPVMALTSTGRRSGAKRTTPVTAFACDGKLAAAGMNLGLESSPAWAWNLQADPRAWITLAGRTVPVTARLAEGVERERLWTRWTELQPSATVFAQLARRKIPIFVFEERSDAVMGSALE